MDTLPKARYDKEFVIVLGVGIVRYAESILLGLIKGARCHFDLMSRLKNGVAIHKNRVLNGSVFTQATPSFSSL